MAMSTTPHPPGSPPMAPTPGITATAPRDAAVGQPDTLDKPVPYMIDDMDPVLLFRVYGSGTPAELKAKALAATKANDEASAKLVASQQEAVIGSETGGEPTPSSMPLERVLAAPVGPATKA